MSKTNGWQKYMDGGDYAAAIEELNKIAGDDAPSRFTRHYNLGIIYTRTGEHRRAQDELKRALETGMETGRVHAEMGRLLERQGRWDDAEREFLRAAGNGYGQGVRKDLARIAGQRGDHARAAEELEKAVKDDPDNAALHFELGIARRKSGDAGRAIQAFETAVLKTPENARVERNRALNELEYTRKDIVLTSKPRCLWITLTSRCNLRCIMCGEWQKSWELPQKTVREIQEYLPYLEEVRWQGGEVFLSREFEKLFDEAAKNPRLKQNINTNGLLINERWAGKLARRNVNLAYAIDGVTRETYEKIRLGGSFDDLLRGIEIMNRYKEAANAVLPKDERMTTMMSFIVMRSNYRELADTIEFARSHQFDSLQVYPVGGLMDAENVFARVDHEVLKEVRAAAEVLARKSREYGIELLMKLPVTAEEKEISRAEPEINAPDDHAAPGSAPVETPAAPEPPAPPAPSDICHMLNSGPCILPWQHMFIDGSGEVRPSCDCEKTAGSVSVSSLQEIWNGEGMQRYRRALLENRPGEACRRTIGRELLRIACIREDAERKDYAGALHQLTGFMADVPEHPEAHLLMGRMLIETKELTRAVETLREAVRLAPGNGEIRFELGRALGLSGDRQGALAELDEAIRLGFDEFQCQVAVKDFFFRHDTAVVLERLRRMLELRPGDGSLFAEMGRIYQNDKKDPAVVREMFLKAIAQGYDNVDVHLNLICALHEGGDYGAEGDEIDRALARWPDDGRLYLEKGVMLRMRGDDAAAEKACRAALEKGYDIARIHRELGYILSQKGDGDTAVKEFRKALEMEPSVAELHRDIGRILAYQKKDFDGAAKELEEAVSKGMDSMETLTELATFLREAGKGERAVKYLGRCQALVSRESQPARYNRLASEIELAQGRTRLSSRPRVMTVTLTSRCQLDCVMCRVRKDWPKGWDLPEKTALEVMEYMPSMEYVIWSGGEVFLYPHFAKLFEEGARYPSLRQEIVTNGHLIDDAWAKRLASSNLTLIYSIDAFTKDPYEKIRRGARFDALLKSIDSLGAHRKTGKEDRLNLVLNFVVMRSNLPEMEKAITFAAAHGFNEVRFAEVKFLTDPENIFMHPNAGAAAYLRRVVPSLEEQAKEKGITMRKWFLNLDAYDASVREARDGKHQEGPPPGPEAGPQAPVVPVNDTFFCYLPWREMYLEPGGTVKLQCFCNRTAGNVHKSSLDDIWNGPVMRDIRRRILDHKCAGFCDPQCLSGKIPGELLGCPVR